MTNIRWYITAAAGAICFAIFSVVAVLSDQEFLSAVIICTSMVVLTAMIIALTVDLKKERDSGRITPPQ